MCLYIIHFLFAVNYDKKVVQTHFSLLFVNKKYPVTYILLWKEGWFWLFTHFANKKPSDSPRAFYCCKMCKKSKSPPFYTIKSVLNMKESYSMEKTPKKCSKKFTSSFIKRRGGGQRPFINFIKTSQKLRMLSPSLFIQWSQCKC